MPKYELPLIFIHEFMKKMDLDIGCIRLSNYTMERYVGEIRDSMKYLFSETINDIKNAQKEYDDYLALPEEYKIKKYNSIYGCGDTETEIERVNNIAKIGAELAIMKSMKFKDDNANNILKKSIKYATTEITAYVEDMKNSLENNDSSPSVESYIEGRTEHYKRCVANAVSGLNSLFTACCDAIEFIRVVIDELGENGDFNISPLRTIEDAIMDTFIDNRDHIEWLANINGYDLNESYINLCTIYYESRGDVGVSERIPNKHGDI